MGDVTVPERLEFTKKEFQDNNTDLMLSQLKLEKMKVYIILLVTSVLKLDLQ